MSTYANIIDAHLHVWKRTENAYAWLCNVDTVLQRDFTPEQAEKELQSAGVSKAILVQADDTSADTDHMIAIAETNSWVAGVVAWVPLEDPAEAERRILEFRKSNLPVCGIRQLIHDDPRSGLLDAPLVRETLGIVAKEDLSFDVPDAWPRDLSSVNGVADHHPTLKIVVDHLGKPPRESDQLEDWATTISHVAERSNVYAKLSGLHYLNDDQLKRVWEVALEAFGPERLLWGSDWPMPLPYGDYRAHAERVWGLLNELTVAERRAILRDTACPVYGLDLEK